MKYEVWQPNDAAYWYVELPVLHRALDTWPSRRLTATRWHRHTARTLAMRTYTLFTVHQGVWVSHQSTYCMHRELLVQMASQRGAGDIPQLYCRQGSTVARASAEHVRQSF